MKRRKLTITRSKPQRNKSHELKDINARRSYVEAAKAHIKAQMKEAAE